ncbi:MAG: PHP domain-containing protein [Lachnospiraceae bacterium]|nr:PHP domain-containing protein [Lachnospiraceae bacterium]
MNERVELHCHTKMSRMMGLVDVRELINKALEMRMPAIAITDIDSVQAFPIAYQQLRWSYRDGKDDPFKVIFGIEAWIFDDVGKDSTAKRERNGNNYRAVIIAANPEGLKNLYELISAANMEYFDVFPRIPRKLLSKKRKGLIVGSCAMAGEIGRAVAKDQKEEDVIRKIGFYDFVEVEPVCNYIHSFRQSVEGMKSEDVIKRLIKKTVKYCEAASVPVIASTDVYYINKSDKEAYKVLRYSRGSEIPKGWKVKHHLMPAKELMEEFGFLGEKTARTIVLDNPEAIAEKIEAYPPISNEKKYLLYPDADKKLKELSYDRAYTLYGKKLPPEVRIRLETELKGIIDSGYASIYMITHELVKKSNDAGYPVGSRGSSASSFVSFLMGITEINPLPAHYICRKCGYTDFDVFKTEGFHPGYIGADLPERVCPVCGEVLHKDGFDIPMETFFGIDFGREPDFDLNFSPEFQKEAQRSLADIKGIAAIYRPGTVSTITEDAALKFAEKYYRDKKNRRNPESIKKVAERIVGVRKDNGVHPGGIIAVPEGVDINEYTPIVKGLYDEIPLTHLEYHSFDGYLMKIDILGHDTPSFLKYLHDKTGVDPKDISFDDRKILSLFSGTKELGIDPEQISGITIGTLGSPEFGSAEVRNMIEMIRPKSISDIIKINSIMHGTNSWYNNAEEIIRDKTASFSECIASRDDIMLYLIDKGFDRITACRIMDSVRKGKGIKEEWVDDLRKKGVPDWYIGSCNKVRYLFPKAHAASYTLMSWRILYYKLYYPEAFYEGWLKYYAHAVDRDFVDKGYDHARETYESLAKKDCRRLGFKHKKMMNEIPVVMEMLARGIRLE